MLVVNTNIEVGLHEKGKIPHPDQWAGMAGTEALVHVIAVIHQIWPCH